MSGHKPLVDTDSGFVAGNYYDKYHTKNPIARFLMDRFLKAVVDLTNKINPCDIHEIGCGEGHLTVALSRPGRKLRGSDVSPAVVGLARAAAERADVSASFKVSSIYELDASLDSAEMVICCEVLEHLPDPEAALVKLAALAKSHLMISVPREPVWRILNLLRGKYWSDLGNTPGHLQHWSKTAFIKMLERYFDVVEVRSPLPWTIVLCRSRYML